MKTNIPQLANTASEVLRAALAYDCAGYQLVFNVVMEGEWRYNRQTNKFDKLGSVRGVPVIERVECGDFDAWLIGQIARGFVTISCGDRNYFKELHRATARTIPIEPEAIRVLPISDTYGEMVKAVNAGNLTHAQLLAIRIAA